MEATIEGGSAADLTGAWQITERVSSGVDDREPDDDAKFLWFHDGIIVTGDQWAAWDMPYVARSGTTFGEIDVRREDTRDPWLHLGIFRVTEAGLRLCMARDRGDRPVDFSSTESNGCLLYACKRSTEPLPMQPTSSKAPR